MLYRETIAVCSQIHTNTLFKHNAELLNVKFAVHIVTAGTYSVKRSTAADVFHVFSIFSRILSSEPT